MQWAQLLSGVRTTGLAEPPEAARTHFQRDFDRIVFSSAFRRMHGKTQVFPLPRSDLTHTRLSHSLEVSCVARSLGALVGARLNRTEATPEALGAICAAAALAHDIGNPPFGHSGEAAISDYFSKAGQRFLNGLTREESTDFIAFEGNALAFRILTRTKPQQSGLSGGLGLTHATIGAFTKYPRPSSAPRTANASEKKYGLFASDVATFRAVASSLGLPAKGAAEWSRHPLAFLVEAADDICYRIIDLEDGYRLDLVPYDLARTLLVAIADGPPSAINKDTVSAIRDRHELIGYLRAKAINNLAHQVADAFVTNADSLLVGSFESPLISLIPSSQALAEVSRVSKEDIYTHRPVVEIEAAGYEVLGGLLEDFLKASIEDPGSPRSRKILSLLPDQTTFSGTAATSLQYDKVMDIVEYVAGMTDAYAISTYRVLRGIDLPRS